MIPHIDIWRSASVMLMRYGGGAALEAAQRADRSLAAGNVDGYAVWKRILAAIYDLERTSRSDSERMQ